MTPAARSRQREQVIGESAWSASRRRIAITGPLGFSLIALLLAGAVILFGLGTVMTTAFGRGTGRVQPAEELDKLVAQHVRASKSWQARFNGRSVFFKPPRPYTPPPPVQHVAVENSDPPPPPPPTIPTKYDGPSIAFAVGPTVYFSPMTVSDKEKFIRIQVGEEKQGLKVISMSLPWSVKLGYKGGEFDVPIFARNEEGLFFQTKGNVKPILPSPFIIAAPSMDDAGAASNSAAMTGGDHAGTVSPAAPNRLGRSPISRASAPPAAAPDKDVATNQNETGDAEAQDEGVDEAAETPVVEEEDPATLEPDVAPPPEPAPSPAPGAAPAGASSSESQGSARASAASHGSMPVHDAPTLNQLANAVVPK